MKYYLNGQWVEASDAKISVDDAGIEHGVGVFATMRAFYGQVMELDAHVHRLIESAKELGLSSQLRHAPLCEAVEATLKENNVSDARLKLVVTGGDLSLLAQAKGQQAPGELQPTIMVKIYPPTSYPPSLYEEGIMVALADPKVNPFDLTAGHKTLNYWLRLRTLAQVAAAGAGEALWFSVTNHLCGGSVSNIFLVKDGILHTPIASGEEVQGSLPSPVRAGVIRSLVMEIAEAQNIEVKKQMLSIEEVLAADEVFLTNSSWLLMPVTRVEQSEVGEGKVGPVTCQLSAAVLERINQMADTESA